MVVTTIKATCPDCGDIELAPDDIRVELAPTAGWSAYIFTCPQCAVDVRKDADDEVVGLLRSAGVQIDEVLVPLEALELHDGPPLDLDDLIDFGQRLAATDELVAVLAREEAR